MAVAEVVKVFEIGLAVVHECRIGFPGRDRLDVVRASLGRVQKLRLARFFVVSGSHAVGGRYEARPADVQSQIVTAA